MNKFFRGNILVIFVFFLFPFKAAYSHDEEPGLTKLYEYNISYLIEIHCGPNIVNLTLPNCLEKLLPEIRKEIALQLRFSSADGHWLAGTEIYQKLFPEHSLFFEQLVEELTTPILASEAHDGKIHYPYMIQKRGEKFYFISLINTSRAINYVEFATGNGTVTVPGKFRAMAETYLIYQLWREKTVKGATAYQSSFNSSDAFTNFFLNTYFNFAKKYGHLFLFKNSLLQDEVNIFSFLENKFSPSVRAMFGNYIQDNIKQFNNMLNSSSQTIDAICAEVMREYRGYLLLQGSAIMYQLELFPYLTIEDTASKEYKKYIEKFTMGSDLSWVTLQNENTTPVEIHSNRVHGFLAELLGLEELSKFPDFFWNYNFFTSALAGDPFVRDEFGYSNKKIIVLKGYEYLLFHLYNISSFNDQSLMSADQNIFSQLAPKQVERLRRLLEVFQTIYDPTNKLKKSFEENGFCGLKSLLPFSSLP